MKIKNLIINDLSIIDYQLYINIYIYVLLIISWKNEKLTRYWYWLIYIFKISYILIYNAYNKTIIKSIF